MLILNETELRGLLGMREAVQAVEQGFRALGMGQTRCPERINMALPELGGTFLEMPSAMLPGADEDVAGNQDQKAALGTKIVTVFGANRDRGMDVVQSIYILLDPATGKPIAIMDGKFITGIRTAAASALATQYMARQGPTVLGIIGAGVQAAFHIEAMICTANIERVIIQSRTQAKAERLAAQVDRKFGVQVELTRSPAKLLAECGIICTCTTSPEPLFDGDLVAPGTHINAVGAFTPETRELDTKTIARARVIIDAAQSAGVEAGEILIPTSEGTIGTSHIKGSLSDLVLGRVAGRTSADEVTVFKSCGLAVEDLVTAHVAYRNAMRRGTGTHQEI